MAKASTLLRKASTTEGVEREERANSGEFSTFTSDPKFYYVPRYIEQLCKFPVTYHIFIAPQKTCGHEKIGRKSGGLLLHRVLWSARNRRTQQDFIVIGMLTYKFFLYKKSVLVREL